MSQAVEKVLLLVVLSGFTRPILSMREKQPTAAAPVNSRLPPNALTCAATHHTYNTSHIMRFKRPTQCPGCLNTPGWLSADRIFFNRVQQTPCMGLTRGRKSLFRLGSRSNMHTTCTQDAYACTLLHYRHTRLFVVHKQQTIEYPFMTTGSLQGMVSAPSSG